MLFVNGKEMRTEERKNLDQPGQWVMGALGMRHRGIALNFDWYLIECKRKVDFCVS
jgi:hypothetical protein